MKKITAVIAALVFCALCSAAVKAAVITPYKSYAEPEEFYNGATLMLDVSKGDFNKWLTRELETMKKSYFISTISVYGLENVTETRRDWLFAELKRLKMKIIVRIESYDGASFAFTEEDAKSVMTSHAAIIEYVSKAENRAQVAYFAINMPIDDGAVQKRLNGVNSAKSKNNQASYAVTIVGLMREAAEKAGFKDAKMYLSVFYGWDNTYKIPSYAESGADGYFIPKFSQELYLQIGDKPKRFINDSLFLGGDWNNTLFTNDMNLTFGKGVK